MKMNDQRDISEKVNEILKEFSPEEAFIENKLKDLQSKRSDLISSDQTWIPLNFETRQDAIRTKEIALKRNKALRRDVNILMGKLRSKQCYNPAEDNLKKMIEKYSEILSRPDID